MHCKNRTALHHRQCSFFAPRAMDDRPLPRRWLQKSNLGAARSVQACSALKAQRKGARLRDSVRPSALFFVLFLPLVLTAGAARADIPPEPVAGEEYAACLDREVGGACKTRSGVKGTCIIVEGGPYGQPWPRVVCLSSPEIERGRNEGWVVEREVAPIRVWHWMTLTVMSLIALAGAVRMRRRTRHGDIDAMPRVDCS
jgi:hypothetical protein